MAYADSGLEEFPEDEYDEEYWDDYAYWDEEDEPMFPEDDVL